MVVCHIVMNTDKENLRLVETAALLATAFNVSIEKSSIELLKVPNGHTFPSYIEHVEEKTLYDLAESLTTKDFVGVNGIPMTRPLTFIEIVEKLEELNLLRSSLEDNIVDSV